MQRTGQREGHGPWIDVVEHDDDVPHAFREHLHQHEADIAAAPLVLRVPHRTPPGEDAGPDHWAHLVAAGPTGFTLLSTHDRRTTAEHVPYADVARFGWVVDGGEGRLHVSDSRTGGTVTFRYDTVAHELVERLVAVLRERVRSAQPVPEAPSAAGAPGRRGDRLDLGALPDDDAPLATLQRDLSSRERAAWPVGAHGTTPVHRTGALARVRDVTRPLVMHGAIVGAAPGEVHLLHREPWFGPTPGGPVAHTVLAGGRITGLDVSGHDSIRDVRVARVASGRTTTVVPFPDGSSSGAALLRLVRRHVG